MTIWKQVKGSSFVQDIHLQVWRVVEDQARSTTRKLVDTSDEHDALESIIENSKPKIVSHNNEHFERLHYLLLTPFRYPPLRHGSRFGSRWERSLLYASLKLPTALSEIAFYKFSFLLASEGKLGGNTISYTAFRFNIVSDSFVNLCEKPFNAYSKEISSKTEYDFSQKLGKEMRENKVGCFQYQSARDPQQDANIGIFTPRCLQNNPRIEDTFQSIKCYFTKEVIEFSFPPLIRKPISFDLKLFLVQGKLPFLVV